MLAGQEASMDAEGLFQRSSRASCEGCRGRAILSFGGAPVWSFAEFGDQMDGAVATTWRRFAGLLAGRIRSPLHPHRSWLLKLVAAQPDLTLTEVQQRLADRGVAIGIGSIWRFFDREGISFKKNAAAIRAGQARRRTQKGKLEKASGKD
jgi:hypothetical protein